MGLKFRQIIVITIAISMLGMSILPSASSSPTEEGSGDGWDEGFIDTRSDPVWSDPLDDLSHVYVPGGGLVGVEVSGGTAHLKVGSNNGWIASEIITCPPGFRYDLVKLEVDTPGDSQVLVSILNASADPSEVGFANETVSNYKLLNATDIPLTAISASRYPEIRIQASLVSSGSDMPSLLSWTLYYIGLNEWKDEFRGSGKMMEHSNINFTGDALEVDLTASATGGGPSVGDYEAYPTIVIAGYSATRFLYPNAGHTGYQDEETISASFAYEVEIEDLNKDGYLDVVVADYSADSPIYWGDSSGTYSTSSKFDLDTTTVRAVATGDFDGDGWVDIGFASGSTSAVFMNDGTGSFSAQPDKTISGAFYYSGAGDFNGDGYDDLILSYPNTNIYYGGPQGVSGSEAVTLAGYYPKVDDLDLDGYDDVLTYVSGAGIKVYLGKAAGIDAIADFSIFGTGGMLYYPNSGDINGDGYVDITGSQYVSGNYNVDVFAGASDGWKNSRVHTAYAGNWARSYMADIDKDGADEVVVAKTSGGYGVEIFKSTASWTFSQLVTKDLGYIYDVDFAIPKGEGGGPRAFRGTFETVPITIPLDRKWDVAYLDGTFPQNTSARISILDDSTGNPITGYKELAAMDVDLSGIRPDDHRTIRLEVTIMTELNNTTPVLDSLTVKWMDPREWRDEFYGPSKVDRMLNIDVAGGTMQAGDIGGRGPQLIFSTLLGNANYTTSPKAFYDDGGADYLARDPFDFRIKGTTAADAADVNGDGFMDLAFAVQQTDNVTFTTKSPLFMGGPMGMQNTPQHRFDTTGASGVVLTDIDGDGHVDAVFSQEKRADDDFTVGSILYWGSADGFSDTPDLVFNTTGASDVEVVDVNDDDLLDLVFACFRDASSTSTDSMVFLQDGTDGFCATTPDHKLPTKGARAVAAGDLDGDGNVDLAFANGLAAGFAEIDSFVYWGMAGGGFVTTPLGLPTFGAEDVLVADLDGMGGLDIVFANHWDDYQTHEVDSFVFLGDGSRAYGPDPDVRLPTVGAAGVTATDIDGTGWMDLVFACQRASSNYQVPSYVYLGGGSGWSPVPDVEIPTEGAYSVLAADFVGFGTGGYLSRPIYIDFPARDTGTVHTFRYTATLGASQEAELMLVDADSWEVLGSTSMSTGSHEWDLTGLFRVKEHSAVRVMLVASGLEAAGQFTVDQLWFNWTKRVWQPPQVLDLGLSEPSIYRTQSVDMWLEVTDDYDLPEELVLQLEHRVNGSDTWDDYLMGTFTYDAASGLWRTTIIPKVNAVLGSYDFRASASDLDAQYAEWLEFPNILEIMNNVPTTPVVHIAPDKAVTTSTLNIEFDVRASDVETAGLTYNFTWYRDGVQVPEITDDQVPTYHTTKGENWTVEVRAWDGDEMSMPGIAWVMVFNTPPSPKDAIPYPEMDEDTVDSDWINLSNAFSDNDGDPIEWSLGSTTEHITVEIDHDTGTVTITPAEHWFGEESVTFVASDGEFQTSQTVTVIVHSVNDIPWIATVDGQPVEGDILEYTVKQGAKLVITYTTDDIEGDEIQADVNVQTVDLDETARTITFEPGVDAVGTNTFVLSIWDVESPGQKVSLSFTIEVENENDPMEEPKITRPLSGDSFKVNQSFSLTGICDDPDIQWGQELLFVWVSNISGELGRGSSITATIMDPGTHEITLTVSDPDYQKMVTIIIVIEPRGGTEPPPPPDDDDTGPDTNWALIVGIVVALAVIGAILYIATGKRRTERYEAKLDAEEDAEEKRQSLERTRDAIKDLADEWEGDLAEGETKAKAEAAGWEAEGDDYKEIDMGVAEGTLTMEAAVTAEASDDVKKLFTGVGKAETERSDEEKEAMRIENEKRQYQNAIGRLPYGIPSKELADMDWVDLANCLATCEKKTVEGGKEVAQIEGKWYYTDREDTGTFLKEHGAKKEDRKPKAPSSDKDKLLAKLEERFILGEISEDTYKDLKKKYGG